MPESRWGVRQGSREANLAIAAQGDLARIFDAGLRDPTPLDSAEKTRSLFRDNEHLVFTDLRHKIKYVGELHALEALRLITAHEERHQGQIWEVMETLPGIDSLTSDGASESSTAGRDRQTPGVFLRNKRGQRSGLWVRRLEKELWGLVGAVRLPFGFGWRVVAELPDPRRWISSGDR